MDDDNAQLDFISALEEELWEALRAADIEFEPPLVGDAFVGAGLDWPTRNTLPTLNEEEREAVRASLSRFLEQEVPITVVTEAFKGASWRWPPDDRE